MKQQNNNHLSSQRSETLLKAVTNNIKGTLLKRWLHASVAGRRKEVTMGFDYVEMTGGAIKGGLKISIHKSHEV